MARQLEGKALTERNERLRMERTQYEDDLKWLLHQAQGQRFFKRFFKRAKIFAKTFSGNSKTYYDEGQREMALEYFQDVTKVAPEKLQAIWLELSKEEM
jgi:acetylglutamate synthase